MTPSISNSHFEIWHHDYINFPSKRAEQDKNKIILQIEQGNNDNYIVEILDNEKE